MAKFTSVRETEGVPPSTSSSLSEREMVNETITGELYGLEETVMETENIEKSRTNKRERNSSDEEEWNLVKNKGKKYKVADCEHNKTEVYISSQEKMPKQFALAKLFKKEGLYDIERVKYINPYKIRVDMKDENSIEKLEKGEEFVARGWRIQRAMEVNMSYGVIKDIDVDLKEEEILSGISCPDPAVLMAVNRLNRRNQEGDGWKPSESVKLSFKGSFRPAFVNVDGLRIKVDPYVFPVSQCSRCWGLGHSLKRCTSTKIVCPKCSDNHPNCESLKFRCVNCNGQHMSLLRICPAYQKEKRLREIMAEYNCTYRRALTMYVPTRCPSKETEQKNKINEVSPLESIPITPSQKPTFAEVINQKCEDSDAVPSRRINKSYKRTEDMEDFDFERWTRLDQPWTEDQTQHKKYEEESKRDVKFSELLQRLKEILFLRGVTIQMKIYNAIKCCIEWVILVCVENVADWPILKTLLDYFIS